MAKRDVKNLQSLPSKMIELPESVMAKLKCTACNKYPIFATDKLIYCDAGHVSCEPCSETQKNSLGCTKMLDDNVNEVCKKSITAMQAPPILEYIYLFSKYQCGNIGCDAIVLGVEMEDHLSSCIYKRLTLPCPDVVCSRTKEFIKEELWEHIEKAHDHSVMKTDQDVPIKVSFMEDNGTSTFKTEELQTLLNAVEVFGEKFVVLCTETASFAFFWAFVLNHDPVAAKFQLTIEIVGQTKNKGERLPVAIQPFRKLDGLRTHDQLLKLCEEKKALMISKEVLSLYAIEDEDADNEENSNGEGETNVVHIVCVMKIKIDKK